MVTMIALAVLMVLVVGAIRFTGTNREAAVSKLKGDRMAACAETARRYLLSRMRIFGVAVTELNLVGDPQFGTTYAYLPDDPLPAKQSIIGPGHFGDNLTSPVSANKPQMVPGSMMAGSAALVRDLANAAPASPYLGGSYYRVVMKCQEGSGARESEIEFVFRYGL